MVIIIIVRETTSASNLGGLGGQRTRCSGFILFYFFKNLSAVTSAVVNICGQVQG
jgi:hypothetical protein